jgi:hypothetical protein
MQKLFVFKGTGTIDELTFCKERSKVQLWRRQIVLVVFALDEIGEKLYSCDADTQPIENGR